MTSTNLRKLRAQYLFQLARLCHLRPDDVDELDLGDFANYIDSCDEWIDVEIRMAGLKRVR